MTLHDIIYNDTIRFILSGGKGGVGKTTCAGAMAVLSAEHGFRTLVISTDPAHSLSDSFNQNLSGGEVIPIEGVEKLWGMEIDTEKGMNQFQDMLGSGAAGAEGQMASQLMGDMGGMSPPGSDEAMAFGKILEFVEDASYDRVIFDTAPTGHTLKLLELPDMLDSWLGRILTLRQRLSSMMSGFKSMFGSQEQEDTSWQMLQQTKEKIKLARDELSNPDITQFVVVMIPEAMAVFETQRLLGSLDAWDIPANNIIVNQIVPPNPDCTFCNHRRQMQQRNLADIRDLFHDMDITELRLFQEEIRGIEDLRKIGKILASEEKTS
ncbi:MAG: AAA family ATPase [Candidatus Lokiarchaeota archaeon]|nr:AAA family ATPase [Candidatus Lokiarchaeota archaeon]